MKTARQQKKTGEASAKSKASADLSCKRTKTYAKRTGQRQKATRKTDTSLHEKDEHPVPSTPQENFQQLPVKEIGHSKASDNMTTVQIELGQMPQPSRRMKLQLFPIDEGTRIGLEKDGHNPYLELTLSSRKKVGSVLKHLHNKWDTSTVAMGELVLFPYNVRLENLAGYRRWTVKDGDTSSADVYEAIGKPAIFRLRYGWFSDLESKTLKTPFTSSDVLQSEDVQKHCSGIIGTMNRHKQPSEDNLRTSNGTMLSSLAWADSLTNISIGGLLSETSLQGNINQCDPVPTANQSSLQQLPFSSDSFDAAIAAHIYSRPQGPTPPSLLSHSSILDAEETCHAFPFQKFSLSGKEIVSSSRSGSSRGCSQDACSKSFKFPNFVEVGVKTGNTQDQTQEPKADTRPQTQGADNGENSLGMSDINRTDSLWSLDLSLSSSRQIIKGDSVSLGGLLSNSLDAFQSRSFFLRDEMVPPT